MVVNYRKGYNIFASNGILFNHESPRRGETFVSRKITRGVAAVLAKKQDYLYLGNLEAKRDWRYAPEYVEMMWKMLQYDSPLDTVVGMDESHSVKEFAQEAFSYVGFDWEKYVKIDPRYLRPTDAGELIADFTKVKENFGWQPKIRFKELVRIMVDADMRKIGLKPIGEGDKILKEKFPNRWWGID